MRALLDHPDGLSAGRLTTLVYGADGNPVTLRAELSRLRAFLGSRLASRPYRIIGPWEWDSEIA